jgi:hypothetical protein
VNGSAGERTCWLWATAGRARPTLAWRWDWQLVSRDATLHSDAETNRELYGRDVTNREILTGDFKTMAAKFESALNRESPQRER